MYKIMQSGCEIIWEPLDRNLGFKIVEEVTGKKGNIENPVLVTEEERDKIIKLYAERNNDPKEKPKVAEPSVTDTLAKEITKLKIESMKEKAVNTNLGKEVTRLKLGMMKLQGGKLA